MESTTIKAYAKINLTLEVLGRRADGFHELRGVMQSVSLFDTVCVEKADAVTVASNVALPENNTLFRAAQAFLTDSGRGAAIAVTKRIPSEAGMGGASADAAAVIRALCLLYPDMSSTVDIMRVGLSVGADVPFCLFGGCALAEGIGERLTPIPSLPLNLLIVKGKTGISTARLFQYFDDVNFDDGNFDDVNFDDVSAASDANEYRLADAAIVASMHGDAAALAAAMHNGLQPAAERLSPEIAVIAAKLRECGAIGVSMTGSGSAVVGVFSTLRQAQLAKPAFCEYPFAEVCTTVSTGVEPL